MLGRPILLYIFSNVGESALKAPSAISFTRRRGWSFGTRSPGVLRLKTLSCCFLCPRITPSAARKRSCPGAAVDPPTLLSQHPARRLGGDTAQYTCPAWPVSSGRQCYCVWRSQD